MVDRSESGEFCEKSFEKSRRKRLDGRGDRGFIGENNVLSNLWVGGEETPIHICAIPDIRVVILSSGILEDFLNECLSLSVLRFLEKEFDNRCEDLKLRLVKISEY